MTLYNIADLTPNGTTIAIIPNYNANKIIRTVAIMILTADSDHNTDIYKYCDDDVEGIFPSAVTPGELCVIIRHND